MGDLLKVISKKPITLEEAKRILDERAEEGTELLYVQEQTIKYLDKFADKSREKKEEKIIEELKGMVLSEEMAVKIVEVWPEHPDTLRTILAKEKVELDDAKIEEIMKLLK